jgi:3-phytase
MNSQITTIRYITFIFLMAWQAQPQTVMAVTPVVEPGDGAIHFTRGEVRDVTITPGDQSYLLVAASFDGIVSLSPQGSLLDSFEPENALSEIVSIAVSDMRGVVDEDALLVAMMDWTRFRIIFKGLDTGTGKFTDLRINNNGIVTVPPRTTHLCFARDLYDQSLYLFAGGDHGRLLQFKIYQSDSGALGVRELQEIVIGGPTTSCYSENQAGLIYVTEPDMGLWRVISDPEEVPVREPVLLNGPYGELSEAVSVAGLLRDNQPMSLIADVDSEVFLRVSPQGNVVEKIHFNDVLGILDIDGDVASIATGVITTNEKSSSVMAVALTGDADNGEVVLIPLPERESALGHDVVTGDLDAIVVTQAISAPVTGGMDAADDPAIWIHPDEPAQSLVIGADKGAGLGVYDLQGNLLQFLPDGRINNVDVRGGVSNNPVLAHIAVGSDRTNYALAIYAIDPDSRQVRRVDARIVPVEFNDVYGLCMYQSGKTGDLYAFGTSADGWMHQWRLFEIVGNKIDAELVRRINIGTVTEGCVVDDEHGYLYAAEERVGVWRYGAEPGDGEQREAVAMIEPGGVLTADLEGMAIYDTGQGRGFLVVTSQGSDNYSVYDRLPPHAYRGTFRIRTNPESGLDGTSQTDGIDITNVPLPGYPKGLLVAQDGRYDQSQNFKYVSWQDIAYALGLQ